ncbi:hypothetical protein KCU73_g6262, partial [Aureobasidium melanogenum]
MAARQIYQICINDDRNLYVWKDTWKEDTIADFLTRLSNSTNPRLNRHRIHLSFDGVRLSESTTMRETGLEDGDELALHYGPSHACKLCTGSHNGTGYMTRQSG